MTELALACYAMAGEHDHEAAEATLEALRRNDRFALAAHLVQEGFSVCPLCSNGKRPTRKWKPYQYRLPTTAELIEWFVENDYTPAIVTGEISGITVIDCDSEEAVDLWMAHGPFTGVQQQTRRGRHFIFRHAGERNTVRVNRWDGVDRRGEGGYVKAYRDAGDWTRDKVMRAPMLTEKAATESQPT